MTLTPEQLEIRKQGITATDIAAIVGAHPWRTPLDVWLEKTGRRESFEGNERTKWGNLLEPVIRDDYAERHGCRVEVPSTLTDPHLPWRKATPDGLVYPGNGLTAERGLEIKVHGRDAMLSQALHYGDPGTDEVPNHELIQCMWNIAVTGLARWDLVAFDGIPVEYIIERDDELIGILSERGERFLVDHVRADRAPDPDGTKAYETWIAGQYKARNDKEPLLDVTNLADVRQDIERLRMVRAELATLAKSEATLEQRLKLVIGDNAGIEWPSPRGKGKDHITYKQARDGVRVSYEGPFSTARNTAALAADGTRDAVTRALTVLDKFADATFENSRATMRAPELRDLIATMHTTLAEIAKLAPETTPAPGSRRFCVPRWWGGAGNS